MNFNEIGLKDLVLDFDSNDLQDITIVQGDTKTRGFKVLVSTNNGEIIKASNNYEMRLYGINSNYPDKSFFTKGTIDGDFYKVYISTDMASKSGKLQLQLALFEGKNALIQSRIKEVDVYRSIANGGNVGKDLVVDFGKLKEALETAEKQQKKFEESLVRQEAVESKIAEKHTEVVQIRDGLKDVLSTENARVEAEKKRVSAEDVRASQESIRQSNENTRQSNENARQQNESTRKSNENQRQAEESTRKTEEQKRVSAETNRNSEETRRDNAEKIRVENENKRISAENKRAENDTTYNKNEEQRQEQESTRQTQEQERVEAEKLRQSQETTRKQSEDTRASQEKTRQSQEQSRVDAESKRETSETSREKSEQARITKDTERQNAEQTRQSNEQTRVSQESSRVEAEKQRAAAESDRAGKFAGWDKTMQGVIPTATSTVAGIVRIDVDGESMAVSKKTYDEDLNQIKTSSEKLEYDLKSQVNSASNSVAQIGGMLRDKIDREEFEAIYKEMEGVAEAFNIKADKEHTHTTDDITDLKSVLSTKASKEDIDKLSTELTEKVDNFKVEAATSKTAGIVKIDVDGENTAISKKSFDESVNEFTKTCNSLDSKIGMSAALMDTMRDLLSDNSRSISSVSTALDKKADKSHTHSISDVEGLQNELAQKASNNDLANVQANVDEKTDKNVVDELDERVETYASFMFSNHIDKKVGSDTVKNIAIIEKGASTSSIAPNTLIFEKE